MKALPHCRSITDISPFMPLHNHPRITEFNPRWCSYYENPELRFYAFTQPEGASVYVMLLLSFADCLCEPQFIARLHMRPEFLPRTFWDQPFVHRSISCRIFGATTDWRLTPYRDGGGFQVSFELCKERYKAQFSSIESGFDL